MSWWATAHVGTATHAPNGEPLTRDEKLVLLILADHHDVSSNCAWPAIPRLAEMALMCRRHVIVVLQELERKYLIAVCRGTGRGHGSTYTLLTVPDQPNKAPQSQAGKGARRAPFPVEENPAEKVHSSALKGAQRVHKGCTVEQCNKEEPIEPIEPSSSSSAAAAALVSIEKVNKKAAAAAATPEDLSAMAEVFMRYRQQPNTKVMLGILSTCRQRVADVTVAEVAAMVDDQMSSAFARYSSGKVESLVAIVIAWSREYFTGDELQTLRAARANAQSQQEDADRRKQQKQQAHEDELREYEEIKTAWDALSEFEREEWKQIAAEKYSKDLARMLPEYRSKQIEYLGRLIWEHDPDGYQDGVTRIETREEKQV